MVLEKRYAIFKYKESGLKHIYEGNKVGPNTVFYPKEPLCGGIKRTNEDEKIIDGLTESELMNHIPVAEKKERQEFCGNCVSHFYKSPQP